MAFVDEAVALADAGFYLLPVVRGLKMPALPATGRGHADKASNDPELVRYWFTPGQHDVAIVPHLSNHVVLDVDTKHGQPGVANLVRLEQQYGYWPWRLGDVTATATSANGGWHHWFSLPPDVNAYDLRSGLAGGVELQRYLVVSPPSPGRRWARPPEGDIIQIPDGLLDLARRPKRELVQPRPRAGGHVRGGELDHVKAYLIGQPEGSRHNCLRWAALVGAEHVKHGRTSVAEVLSLIETATCRWGDMPEGEAVDVVHWCLTAVLGDGWSGP